MLNKTIKQKREEGRRPRRVYVYISKSKTWGPENKDSRTTKVTDKEFEVMIGIIKKRKEQVESLIEEKQQKIEENQPKTALKMLKRYLQKAINTTSKALHIRLK